MVPTLSSSSLFLCHSDRPNKESSKPTTLIALLSSNILTRRTRRIKSRHLPRATLANSGRGEDFNPLFSLLERWERRNDDEKVRADPFLLVEAGEDFCSSRSSSREDAVEAGPTDVHVTEFLSIALWGFSHRPFLSFFPMGKRFLFYLISIFPGTQNKLKIEKWSSSSISQEREICKCSNQKGPSP